MQPTIISSYDGGKHNADLTQTVERLDQAFQWRDLSLVVIVPSGGTVATRVVSSWWSMMMPPNNKSVKLFAVGMEVGMAYSACIESVLSNPELSQWKYILTLEHDNVPPADGVIRLLERAEAHPEFSAIGGLYFTKGPGGVAQIWGDPKEKAVNFRPQLPALDGGLVECCGTGMGFTLFRLETFKDQRLRRPWFRTVANATEGAFSQDLYFWKDARTWGHRCAVDCSVRVGHYDATNDVIW